MRSGPPPIAAAWLLQFGVSVRRNSTVVPAGASAVRCGACAPRETSTAPPGGIGVPPCARTCVTTPGTTLFGRVGGSDAMTSSTTPLSAGVAGPHADVYSVVWPETGLSLRSSWRRWLVPRHVPSNATRATASVPSGAMPRLEREESRRLVERAAAHDDPGRGAVPGEEVAVDADLGGRRARILLDVGEPLGPGDRIVGERRRKRVERAVRLRRGDDVEDDRAARRELHLALIRHARHEQLLRDDLARGTARGAGRYGERSGDRGEDEQLAKHDPAPG